MTLYGIASRLSGDVEGWWTSRENAEQFLATVLREAPELQGHLWVELVEREPSSPNVDERRRASTGL